REYTASTLQLSTMTHASGLSLPVYKWTIDTNDFTQGDIVTINAKVYPWIGDAASVFDTAPAADGVADSGEEMGPFYLLADPNSTLAIFSVVDPDNGNDTTGAVGTLQ